MRFLLLVLVFFCASACAHDWVQVSSDYESSIYYDRASLKRDGDIVETLLLWDFADLQLTPRPVKPYQSASRLTRFDCAKGGRANVETTFYRGNMAQGNVTDVYRTPDADIRYEWVNPDAPGGESLRQVCASVRQ
jgi:hypothetical protein